MSPERLEHGVKGVLDKLETLRVVDERLRLLRLLGGLL